MSEKYRTEGQQISCCNKRGREQRSDIAPAVVLFADRSELG
ncbi:hypothetical protein [Ruminococcus sp. YE78]|nr:hypothetical protein [Ruminococcus sp. YE78]